MPESLKAKPILAQLQTNLSIQNAIQQKLKENLEVGSSIIKRAFIYWTGRVNWLFSETNKTDSISMIYVPVFLRKKDFVFDAKQPHGRLSISLSHSGEFKYKLYAPILARELVEEEAIEFGALIFNEDFDNDDLLAIIEKFIIKMNEWETNGISEITITMPNN